MHGPYGGGGPAAARPYGSPGTGPYGNWQSRLQRGRMRSQSKDQ